MSKKITVKNITRDPAVPIGLMVQKCGGAVGAKHGFLQVNTDDVPVELTEEQYKNCKDAIDNYVEADKLKLSIIDITPKPEKVKDEDGDSGDDAPDTNAEDTIRARGKELKLPSWHVMGLEKLEAAIAEKEAELKDED